MDVMTGEREDAGSRNEMTVGLLVDSAGMTATRATGISHAPSIVMTDVPPEGSAQRKEERTVSHAPMVVTNSVRAVMTDVSPMAEVTVGKDGTETLTRAIAMMKIKMKIKRITAFILLAVLTVNSGIGKRLKEKNPNIKIVAVEPKSSAVLKDRKSVV